MSETETQPQDGQKTIVSFIVGLLIGGLLVWVFSAPASDETTPAEDTDTDTEMTETNDNDSETEASADTEDSSTDTSANTGTEPEPAAELEVGEGSVSVDDQPAGMEVALNGAVYPVEEGWIGVRGYENENLTSLLGVVRFSESQGLVPDSIVLQAPTQSGREYAVVVYRENGDFNFSLAEDVQIDEIYATFTAQ